MTEEPRRVVVIEPDPLGFRVHVELAPSDDLSRTYREKNDAWRYAQDLWTTLRAPLRDMTDGNVSRDVHPGPPKKICRN